MQIPQISVCTNLENIPNKVQWTRLYHVSIAWVLSKPYWWQLLSVAVTESSFSVTLGHINTRKLLHSHLTSAGLTQEEDKGDKPHKQYSSSCLLPACLPSREIWLQLRREQLGVSWKSRSTGECCQSSGVTVLMEEEKKLSDVARGDDGLSAAVQ